ncbi:MAG: DegT/DnrJ/EryC1/StrS family aminotransferase [Planctomycetota bacterium]|jgi:dTDP-4-amino-4,6-dideoxygalactose transaminase
MAKPIGLVDIRSEHDQIRGELDAAIRGVIDSGAFVLGPQVTGFEDELATHLGVKEAVGVNSGTDALTLGLDVVRTRRGPGEVITTPYTFFATAEAVLQAGHDLVFADIEPDSFNLDPVAVKAAATSRTVGVMPVHLYGQCADMDALTEGLDADFVEDAAQAIGATYKGRPAGGLGLAAGFSFYVTKNLGAIGDAGAVTSYDPEVAALVRSLRAHGEVRTDEGRSYHYEHVGRNSRLDGLQAAVLRVKLRRLEEWQARRESNARFYDQAFAGMDGIRTPPPAQHGRHVYHQYVIRAARRDDLRDHLAGAAIGTRSFYPEPLHTQPALRQLGLGEGAFPVAEQACKEVISLPVHAHLEPEDLERVVESVRAFYGAR